MTHEGCGMGRPSAPFILHVFQDHLMHNDVRVLQLKTGIQSPTLNVGTAFRNPVRTIGYPEFGFFLWLPSVRHTHTHTILWLKISVYKLILEFGSQPDFLKKNLLIRSTISSME